MALLCMIYVFLVTLYVGVRWVIQEGEKKTKKLGDASYLAKPEGNNFIKKQVSFILSVSLLGAFCTLLIPVLINRGNDLIYKMHQGLFWISIGSIASSVIMLNMAVKGGKKINIKIEWLGIFIIWAIVALIMFISN